MHRSLRRLTILAVLAAASAAFDSERIRADEVRVVLESGREFQARVDARTNGGTLWLRFEGDATIILRPVVWQRVTRGTIDGRDFSGEEFREAALRLKDRRVTPRQADVSFAAIEVEEPTFARRAQQALAAAPKITEIQTGARLGNWDDDVAADGLVLDVAAFSADERYVHAEGTVEAELFASRDGGPLRRIARWTRRLQPATNDEGSEFRLPFHGVHPEFDWKYGPKSLVKLSINIPGHGVFHRTISDVRIRPYSAERDRMQRRTGHRFLPGERAGD